MHRISAKAIVAPQQILKISGVNEYKVKIRTKINKLAPIISNANVVKLKDIGALYIQNGDLLIEKSINWQA